MVENGEKERELSRPAGPPSGTEPAASSPKEGDGGLRGEDTGGTITPRRTASAAHRKVIAAGEQWRDECRVVADNEVPVDRLMDFDPAELQQQAVRENVPDTAGLARLDLVEAIVRNRVVSQNFVWGGGVLEIIRDGFGFLRQPENSLGHGKNDVYVSPSQIRRFQLRPGSTVCGQVRPPKTGEGYPALLRVEMVDGHSPRHSAQAVPFEELVPTHPHRRIQLDSPAGGLVTRLVDLLAPAGFGQRSLIVSPPRAGKTLLLQSLALAVAEAHPETWITLLLIDERPEDVTEIRQLLSQRRRCEVLASTFDQSPASHLQLASLVMQRSRRLVEAGVDVVVFVDSLTRLARASNSIPQPGTRTRTASPDAFSLEMPKAFFGSARETENAGSLTLFATVLVETGNPLDQLIFDGFQGTGNMEIVLSRELAEQRIRPGIDPGRTGTRRDEKLSDSAQAQASHALRQHLLGMDEAEATLWLMDQLSRFPTNQAFLTAFARQQSGF